MSLHLHPALVPFLKCEGVAHPSQGLLLGSRVITLNGPFSVAKLFSPFGDHGQELSTLLNYYLNDENMILGWALITSQEIDQETCAIEYFRSLLASLCRVIPANCDSSCSMEELAKNIQRLINQMHGIFVLQTEEDQEILTRYSCWSVEIPLLLVQEYISGQRIVDPEDSLLLLSPETLSEIDPVQLEILSLVQEESQLKDVLAAANIAYGGVASSRKARKHRSSVAGDAVEEALKEIKVSHATFNVLQTPNVVELVEEFCKDSAIFGTLSNNLMALETDSANSELTSPPQQKTDESMQQKLKEYEVLLTWLKVLGQPDDIVLKKIASFEDYEERMKKLGAKLKHSLSPEDLIKTLASIQPTPTPAKSSSK